MIAAYHDPGTNGWFNQMYVRYSTALLISSKFYLINLTDFALISSSSVSIANGDIFNSTHIVIAGLNGRIIMMDNFKNYSWIH